MLIKRTSIDQELEWRNPGIYSTASSTSSSRVASPTGSNQPSRKNSTIPEEAKSSTTKGQSRYTFCSMNLVERRIIKPGTNCLPFPWTHSSDRNNGNATSG